MFNVKKLTFVDAYANLRANFDTQITDAILEAILENLNEEKVNFTWLSQIRIVCEVNSTQIIQG